MTAVEKTKKTVERVEKALKANSIKHEPIDYTPFLFGSSAHDILTDRCTIMVCRDIIEVNEQSVDSIEEMIQKVQAIEGA